MNSTHDVLLFHRSARWLSKRNVLNHVCVMKDGTKLISEKKTNKFLSYMNDKIWLKSIEIKKKLNNINLKLQGKVANIF